jgi:hypothetical protein
VRAREKVWNRRRAGALFLKFPSRHGASYEAPSLH